MKLQDSRMMRWLLPTVYTVIGVITTATLFDALLSSPLRSGILAGASHPLVGLDHFVTLLLVGLWAGLRKDGKLWVAPVSLLAGVILGFLATVPGHLAAAEPVIEFGMMAVLAALMGAMLLRLELPVTNVVGALILLGACHGVTDRVEAGAAHAGPFVMGYLLTATLLLVLGTTVGLASPRLR